MAVWRERKRGESMKLPLSSQHPHPTRALTEVQHQGQHQDDEGMLPPALLEDGGVCEATSVGRVAAGRGRAHLPTFRRMAVAPARAPFSALSRSQPPSHAHTTHLVCRAGEMAGGRQVFGVEARWLARDSIEKRVSNHVDRKRFSVPAHTCPTHVPAASRAALWHPRTRHTKSLTAIVLNIQNTSAF